jgi:hypothetical protein
MTLEERRKRVLDEMARCEPMEYGSLKAEFRPAPGGGTTGPYYKHQVWEDGVNRSQRIRPEEAPALERAIANRQRFEALAQEYVGLTVQWTRQREDLEADKRGVVRHWRRASPRRFGTSSLGAEPRPGRPRRAGKFDLTAGGGPG